MNVSSATDSSDVQHASPKSDMNGHHHHGETLGLTHRIIITLLCIIGTPGNLAVVIVYLRKMTTSTRTYLFSLAVADTAICLSFTIFITVPGPVAHDCVLSVFNAALTFSSVLLAFLATERCLAVALPHKFSLRIKRAKTALTVIGVFSVLYSALMSVAQIVHGRLCYVVLATVMAGMCLLVVISSYSVMAAILLTRLRVSRNQIVPFPSAPSGQAENVSGVETINARKPNRPTGQPTMSTCSHTSHNNASMPLNITSTMATRAQRGSFLLFVVTVVLGLSWLPFFLESYGMDIHEEASHIFTINAVVNPFIYSFVSPMFRNDVRQFYRESYARFTICCRIFEGRT